MNTENEAPASELAPAQADPTSKLTWQTPLLENLSIQDTAGPGGPYDDDDDIFGDPLATLS
ncbi:MAG: hypothetical protein R2873_15360 [Caldilineaceae bacterium]|nr:hypothetical protein [Caldilineaceae bacterium]